MIRRYTFVLWVSFAVCVNGTSVRSPQFRVGICDPVPEYEGGQLHGGVDEELFTALVTEIASRENWGTEFVFGVQEECEDLLATGKVDFVAGLPVTEANREKFEFTSQSIISTWGQIYSTDQAGIKSITDLDDHTLGILHAHPYSTSAREITKRFGVQCRFIEFTTQKELLTALSNRWVDAIVLDRLFGGLYARKQVAFITPVAFAPRELRFAFRSGELRNIRDTLDYQVGQLKSDPGSVYHVLLEKLLSAPDSSRKMMRILCWALGSAGFLIVGTVGFIILLKGQVKSQTAALLEKNMQLACEIDVREEIEAVLRQSMGLLESIFGGLSDGILVLDSRMKSIMKYNGAVSRIYGFSAEEIQGCSPETLIPRLREFLVPEGDLSGPDRSSVAGWGFKSRPSRKDRTSFHAEIRIAPIEHDGTVPASWLVIIRDVSSQILAEAALRESEARLRQAQKMEAIGTLAGGIAHDFNNLLTPIMGFADPEVAEVAENTPAYEALEQIMAAACRGRELVAQILAFSRKAERNPKVVHLAPIVREAMKLMRATLPSTVRLQVDTNLSRDEVMADPTEVHQVVMNLVTNASQAIGVQGGTVGVCLAPHQGPARGWVAGEDLQPIPYLRLTVSDTGPGISPDVLHRIFDPFFTTKGPNQGTGMGLAVVHGIIQSCAGEISVETAMGMGTSFHVYLPLAEAQVEALVQTEMLAPGNLGDRVLFVDDDSMIARLVKKSLPAYGYEVHAHTSSVEAWHIFQQTPDLFDIVITDYTMPDMTGLDLAGKILGLCPDIPILLCSGYSDSVTENEVRKNGIRGLISKPFSPRDMARQIARTLAETSVSQT